MAQQTQIDRVIGYFEHWMDQFPNIESVAKAHEEQILKAWEGLGYYSRARNIQKAAAVIIQEYGGDFPQTPEDIRSLPGVGEYTAGAIASIAFRLPVPAIDANVLRVFSRLLDIEISVSDKAAKDEIAKQVCQILPEARPGTFNQALMELGALVCSKRPLCENCPVSDHCVALKNKTVDKRPVLSPKKKSIQIEMATGVLLSAGKVLIQKRKPDDIWPGLWEFPGGGIESGESPEEALVREYMEEVELDIIPHEKIGVIKYSYTRYRVTMHCYLCKLTDTAPVTPVFNEASEGAFVLPDELDGFAFPSGHRRLLESMREDVRYSSLFSFSV